MFVPRRTTWFCGTRSDSARRPDRWIVASTSCTVRRCPSLSALSELMSYCASLSSYLLTPAAHPSADSTKGTPRWRPLMVFRRGPRLSNRKRMRYILYNRGVPWRRGCRQHHDVPRSNNDNLGAYVTIFGAWSFLTRWRQLYASASHQVVQYRMIILPFIVTLPLIDVELVGFNRASAYCRATITCINQGRAVGWRQILKSKSFRAGDCSVLMVSCKSRRGPVCVGGNR